MSGSGARPRRPPHHRHRPASDRRPRLPTRQDRGVLSLDRSTTHHVEDLGSAPNKVADHHRAGRTLVVGEFARDRIRWGDGRMGTGTPPRRICVGRALVAGAMLPPRHRARRVRKGGLADRPLSCGSSRCGLWHGASWSGSPRSASWSGCSRSALGGWRRGAL